ncbi:hypothetical protein Tco_0492774 [Tanacetum coccineum]
MEHPALRYDTTSGQRHEVLTAANIKINTVVLAAESTDSEGPDGFGDRTCSGGGGGGVECVRLDIEDAFDQASTYASDDLSDFLSKPLYDSYTSNVESETGEKKILLENETSSFETKIVELEMILAQQTKDFEDSKVEFSNKTAKFETYFEKLENIKVVIELARKINDFKAEKDLFLRKIASLESKLASQDLLSNQKEYNELRSSYNALKAKFDSLKRDKGKSLVTYFSKPKVSVSEKVYTGESSKPFTKKVS